MPKKGVFPIVLGETHTTSAATKWGEDTGKQVGVIKIASAHDVTFDSTNYPGQPGDCVVVVNTTGGGQTVFITPDPFGDDTMDQTAVAAGETVCVFYHETHGWLWFGGQQHS
jgi:hypothetical protein